MIRVYKYLLSTPPFFRLTVWLFFVIIFVLAIHDINNMINLGILSDFIRQQLNINLFIAVSTNYMVLSLLSKHNKHLGEVEVNKNYTNSKIEHLFSEIRNNKKHISKLYRKIAYLEGEIKIITKLKNENDS